MQTEETDTFFITEDEAGERLDKVLAKRFSKAGSRTYFQYLIDEGKVLLNQVPIKKRNKPKAGDEVEIEFILTPELKLEPENIPLDILYEDDAILVINKPFGMVVHPAPGNWTGTFVQALLFHCNVLRAPLQDSMQDSLRPGIVHRLDKDTSGLLIAAKTLSAQQALIEMFANRRIYKEYLGICIGNPGTGKIDAPIGRHPVHRKLMAVLPVGGRAALTHFQTLRYTEKLSLVSINIATGRTHQIRVHMKHCGHFILGDSLYGSANLNSLYGVQRQMLHAHRMRLSHPVTGELLDFKVDMPDDMLNVIKKNKI